MPVVQTKTAEIQAGCYFDNKIIPPGAPRPKLSWAYTYAQFAVVQTKTAESQAGCYFDNEIIPPGAPRPKLSWANTYAQFDQLLKAYPEVHPEDFVTIGILQEQPHRGSAREWGEVASVLANMIGGRQPVVTELMTIINRIQRLDRADLMRATEELALVAVLLRERHRTRVPLGSERERSISSRLQEDLWPVRHRPAQQ